MSNIYTLTIMDIQKETEESVSVCFKIPTEYRSTFLFKPGQFITLQFSLNGRIVRRSYSLCSVPIIDKFLRIGVKRVRDGLVSNYINDTLEIGNEVKILPPDGRFYADINDRNYKTYFLFAAGSGITPILSILKTVLVTEKHSFVHLIYGNRNEESIMFKYEIAELQLAYPERLIVVHCLSKPIDNNLLKASTFRKGRVDREAIQWFISEYPPYAQNVEYYICGPSQMIDGTKNALLQIDVPSDRIFIESFGSSSKVMTIDGVEQASLIATINSQKLETSILKGSTILRALLRSGNQPPYSCEGGVCSTCKSKLIKGTVKMMKNMALSDTEIKEGYILTCQSIPTSAEIEIIYE